jgi:hypothetical protein
MAGLTFIKESAKQVNADMASTYPTANFHKRELDFYSDT